MSDLARFPRLRYAGAVLAVLVATLVRLALYPIFGFQLPLTSYALAVVAVAWMCGRGPAYLALVIGAASGWGLYYAVSGPITVPPLMIFAGLTLYTSIGLIAIRLSEVHWTVRRRLRGEAHERLRAEEQLRAQLELTRTITENATTAIFMVDAQGRCTFMNPAAEAMTGLPFGEVEGKVLHDLIHHHHPDGRPFPLSECPIDRALFEEREVRNIEARFFRTNGESYPVLCSARPVRRDGKWECTVIEARDTTRENEAQLRIQRLVEQLQEQDRRKDEFLAMLAHELRNPMAPIRNAVSLLAMGNNDRETWDWARQVIDRQARHLASLVDDLLDIGRINQGKIALDRAPLLISAFVQPAVESCRPLLDARQHRLEVHLPAEPLRVDGDLTRLTQVVQNMLNNAAKYTPEGGHIRLDVTSEAGSAVIHIRDNGVGIPAEMLPRVFDLFTQVERSIDRAEGGLGIGLTLVKRLVEMHGGSVEARSDGPGTGSAFIVRLPLLAQETVRHGSEGSNGNRAVDAGRPLRILVVDDSRDAAESLARLLRRLHHDVVVAHDGPSALDLALATHPDLALLDIGLPGMDGYELARRLRSEPAHDGIELVALTGYGGDADRRRSLEAGFDDHLVKPIEFDALQLTIERARVGSV
ncbi:MAG: ATP-binding protein [Isosphaeraceae bacterium]